MLARLKTMLSKLTPKDRCPHRLALAASLAIYISFSPFFGLHTIMHIVFGWAFNLNIPLLLLVGYGINNPWTMMPIYLSGYLFGHWLLHTLGGLPIAHANPAWMSWVNGKLSYYLGVVDVSFWAFMIGANILGIALAFATYPFFKNFFGRLVGKVSY